MATLTELLRAAEHMRHQGALMLEDERWHVGTSYCEAADMLEREAKRLQAVEARRSKRSWPEGWPPFAVLRRAYTLLDITPVPSTRWLENNGYKHDLDRARSIRADWADALASEVYAELPP